MAGRPSKPVQLIKLEGKSHRTKAELEHREKMEKALYTGMDFKESPAVKLDPVAHKEFLRLKKLYKQIEYVDGLDEQIINRYCKLVSQEQSIQEMISDAESNETKLELFKEINKTRDMLLKLEDQLFLNPTARVKSIPKTPSDDKKESPMAEFLKRRGNGGYGSKSKALEVVEFIPMLKLVDDFYGQPFTLMDWQYETLWDVYGTVNDEGYRQYRYAYLEIPKKNAKTTLIAGLSVYHLTCDPPQGQIYCCAADRQQAGLVYKAAVAMIDQDEELGKILKVTDSRKEILNIETGTILKVLSAEAFTKHGINPTVVIFDELHAQPNRNLWDVMTFGAGAARKEPLWWVITTAGDDPDRNSIGWEIHEQAVKIRDGELIDPTWYVKIFGASEEDDIFDEATWYKTNPSLGQTISIESVRQEALAARNSEASERLFRWLRLNQWISLKRIGWQPLTLWDQTNAKWDLSELVGKKCYPGLDLSVLQT